MTKFVDLPLVATLQEKLAAYKFQTCTPIQERAIMPALAGKDLVATAQTGTGKTLAYLIPAIELLEQKAGRFVEVLVLLPTRELAMQVHEEYEKLCAQRHGPAALVIGGLSEKTQIKAIRAGARMVVATPGRLEDYLRRELIDLRQVRICVLDEADRMLDMGFLPAIRRILGALPTKRQTLCFSATMEPAVEALVQQYLRSPERIALGAAMQPVETVRLQAFEVSSMQKGNLLRDLLVKVQGRTLVFARTKRGAERLAKQLKRDGFAAGLIHGDRSQSQRIAALDAFESGSTRVLVATDVAARGLHIEDVRHVVNYDLPTHAEDFVHRVGRTGRAGASGLASTLVSGAELVELRSIERALKLRIERAEAPTGTNVFVPKNTLPTRTLTALPGEMFA